MSRSRRARSSVCYKEDSFIEDDNRENHPNKANQSLEDDFILENSLREKLNLATPRKSSVRKKLSNDSDNQDDIDTTRGVNMQPKVLLESLSLETGSPRRGLRPRKQSLIAATLTPSKVKFLDNDEDEEDFTENHIEKSTALFTEDDIEGKTLFGFKMAHRKNDLIRKAFETVMESPKTPTKKNIRSTPASPRTPKSGIKKSLQLTPRSKTQHNTPKKSHSIINVEKTPSRFRAKLKKEIQSMVAESDNEDEDFSGSDSSFKPSDSSDECDSISEKSESEHDSDSDGDNFKDKNKKVQKEKNSAKPYTLRNTRGGKDTNYIMRSDDYFTMQGNKKIVTSNHTLERLKNPRLTEDKLQNILKDSTISKEHKFALKSLMDDHRRLYDKWLFILSEGFSIILHGVGSKEKLIQDFQQKKLLTYPCIVINGFFPSLTLKDILDSIIMDMLDMSTSPSNIYEAVELIQREMSTTLSERHLFLLVHNIDGSMLRNTKAQYVLSKLAKIRNVHLIASIDNINAPLIWDHKKLSDYNFSWWDTTTFLPYSHETSYESSLLVHKSGALALSSLKNVFHSLTSNAKGIFMLIVNNQLKNKKTPHYQGISFKDLYCLARESFFVSSDLALRAQLTEFLDHKLVKNKRTVDGTENLVIPIDNVLLHQFAEQNESE